MNDFICSIAMALLSSRHTNLTSLFLYYLTSGSMIFFFHVSKLFFWLIRDLIEVLSSSNLNADHFNLAKIDLLISANNFFSFILKTCKGFQNNWRLTVSNPPGRLTVVIARGDKLKLLVYTSVSCFFRIFCMTAVATFLGNFCARNWRAASHRYWSPGKCPPFDCRVS